MQSNYSHTTRTWAGTIIIHGLIWVKTLTVENQTEKNGPCWQKVVPVETSRSLDLLNFISTIVFWPKTGPRNRAGGILVLNLVFKGERPVKIIIRPLSREQIYS